MKTLCVAVVVLSLISVCQAASPACQNLTKQVDKDPDISGTWHYIAISTENCWANTSFNGSFSPSATWNITASDTPNVHDLDFKMKVFGKYLNKTDRFFYANQSLCRVNMKDCPICDGIVLLQTGCPDCFVLKTANIKTLQLFSRRESVDAAELKEFETQAECLGYVKPHVLSTDHDYVNCTTYEPTDVDEEGRASVLNFFACLFG